MANTTDKETSDLIGQRKIRLEKVKKLRDKGIDPYPSKSNRTHKISIVIDDAEKLMGQEVIIAGRLMSWREHGQLVFGDLRDQSGQIQLYIKSNELEDTSKSNQNLGFKDLDLIDVGDIVEAKGYVTKTQRGELSITPSTVRILTKAIRPLPSQWEGIKDKEIRYRRRYLDFNINPDLRERFTRKSKFFQINREFLNSKGFIEVETPVLEHVTGGADARPFITHHNDLDQDFYLRISTELFQKRLIGAGFEKIFTIGPNFRNEGISDEHLQEYYQVEWYWAYANFRDNMEMLKEMFRYIAEKVWGKTKFSTRGHTFDLADEWAEIDYYSIIKERFNVDIFIDSEDKMLKVLEENNIHLKGSINKNRLIDNLWKVIRKTISGPAFLINEPKFMSPLAKSRPDDERLTERFHIVIGGSELGNGYSEINDPIDQLDRFLDQQKLREEGDDEAQMLDIDFVEMLEYGMPTVSGYGHSERLFWFLEDVTAREGTIFPLMKTEIEEVTKKIYPQIKFDTKKESNQSTDSKATVPNPSNDTGKLPSVGEALAMLEDHVKDDYQKLHSKMVAEALKAWFLKLNPTADASSPEAQLWYMTGLLHDLDYYEYPKEHPAKSIEWFREAGYSQDLIHAIEAHNFMNNGVEPKTQLAAALIACDEMSGFIYAYSLMRPDGLKGMDAKGVQKRLKDKRFAAKISREDIKYGVEKFGVDIKEHIETLIESFTKMEEFNK